MKKIFSKSILILMMACISYTAWANDDDDKKESFKKVLHGKTDNKKPKKYSFTKGDDTLTFDNAKDDTLTFDDKSTEDTLIFADDEMKGHPKGQTGSNEFSIIKTNKVAASLLNPVIYPNPSLGQSSVEINAPDNSITEIIITSQDGTLIKHENITGNSYSLNNLASGNYIITIKNGNQVVQKRLFVK